VQSLALIQQASEANMKFAGLPRGTLRGTIVDVDDPEERGRVRVVFDDMNPEIPQVSGAGEWSKERIGEEPDASHWIDTSPAFKGKQPKGLIGKRVNIAASNGQYQYAVLQDVMFDPQLLAEGKQKKLSMPNNSSMTRLPVYSSGELPPASEENVGCVIIEDGGFDGMQWLSVCLKRSGGYTWVNLMDRLHIHDSQVNDSRGDREGTVNDDTHATT
jgi:hypothetical protein